MYNPSPDEVTLISKEAEKLHEEFSKITKNANQSAIVCNLFVALAAARETWPEECAYWEAVIAATNIMRKAGVRP